MPVIKKKTALVTSAKSRAQNQERQMEILGNVIDPDYQINLYRDWINFLSTFLIQIWSRILNRRNEID